MAATLKISILAEGTILLNGDPVTLEQLAPALDHAGAVWYYRENAAGAAPPAATEVMKLIVARKLPLRLSTLPDFSDSVTPQKPSGMASLFAAIRQRAAQRQIVILRPDNKTMLVPAMNRESAPPDAVAAVEKILPSAGPRSVAVIADTSWTMAPAPSLAEAGRGIPFFGLLMGFAAIGHAVWIFDAASTDTLAAGCAQADLAIIDGARAESFPAGWQSILKPAMRSPLVLIHDRATFQLRRA